MTRRILVTLTLAVTLSLAGLAACGDDDGDSSCDQACDKMKECGLLGGQPCSCESECVNQCIIDASCSEIQTSASSYINCVLDCG